MPKATFEDFLAESDFNKALSYNTDARVVFDILNNDRHILKAIYASESGEPAPAGHSVGIIESYIRGQTEFHETAMFPLDVEANRQAVERMEQTILARFGFKSMGIQKPIDKSFKTEWLHTASCYRQLTKDEMENEEWKGKKWKDVATMKIVVHIFAAEDVTEGRAVINRTGL